MWIELSFQGGGRSRSTSQYVCCHLCGIFFCLLFPCFSFCPNLILRHGNFPLLVSHLLKFLLDAEITFSRSLEQVEVRVTAITNPLLNFYPSHARPMKAGAANICRALNLGQLNAAVVVEGSAWHRHGSLLGLRRELACGGEQKNVCIIKIIKTPIFMTSQATQLLRGERSRSSKTKSFWRCFSFQCH